MSTSIVPVEGTVMASREESDFMPVMVIGRAIERYNAILNFTQQIMKDGKDFGAVPGTDKPTLLKPGAEKLCSFFGLTPRFLIVEKVETWDGAEPFFYYWYKCQLVRNERVIGEGDGSSNSRESKHRYRWVGESQLPPGADRSKFEARDGSAVELEFAIDKAETSGKYGKPASYWKAFNDAITSGSAEKTTKETRNGPKPAWKIGATVYRVPNPDIADQVNTLQKMAQKRAFIAATLIACNASEYYTQDVEDLVEVGTAYPVRHEPRQNREPSTPFDTPEQAKRAVPVELEKQFELIRKDPKHMSTMFKKIGDLMIEKAGRRGEEKYTEITSAFRARYPKASDLKPSLVEGCALDLWDALQALEHPLGDLVTPGETEGLEV